MKIKIKEISIDYFIGVLPYEEVKTNLERLCGKDEVKHLNEYMYGQTMRLLPQQVGIYYSDLVRFLGHRKVGLKGKNMPLED